MSCLELRFVNFLLNEYCIVLYCIVLYSKRKIKLFPLTRPIGSPLEPSLYL